MPVILVLEDDPVTRNGLVETLRQLFERARVATARSDAAPGVVAVERADVVLASLPALERLSPGGSSVGVPVLALTREMSPDTLLRAETLGATGVLRVPTGAQQLLAMLGPIVDTLAQ